MLVKKSEIESLININLKKHLSEKEYIIKTSNPSDFISSKRLDVIAKYLYVYFKEENINSEFAIKLYLEHIKVFNGFVENDESNKIGKKAFLNSFNDLIESLKNNGLQKSKSIIPVSKDNIILDGAHRLATALYFNIKLNYIHLNCNSQKFDFQFFRDRGLKDNYLDYLISQYVTMKDNCYMVILWPKATNNEEEVQNILNANGEIIYTKQIDINLNGMTNLMKIAYKGEKWVGSFDNDFEGARNKAKWCFKENSKLRLYVFESKSNLIDMKEKIRDVFKLGKHAIHINDTKDETTELSKYLLNENSIHYLNFSKNDKKLSNFNKLLIEYKDNIEKKQLNEEKIVLIGGLLGAYGIKDTNDLDYLYLEKKDLKFDNPKIELEESKYLFTNIKYEDLIMDPKNYFYANDVKFLTPKIIYEIKKKRNKGSDAEDLNYLNKLLENKEFKLSFKDYLMKFNKKSFWIRNIKYFLLKGRFLIFTILKKA